MRPPPGPAPFPRPSPLFLGRQDELARCLRLVEHSPLLLAYGVPGIGKTEFIYRLVADLRATRRWQRAQPILLRAQAGQRIEQVVAQLGCLLSGRAAAGDAARPTGELHDELAAVARCLDRTARLIFVDDVHHLEPAEVGAAASYLARCCGGSRLFIASRRELPLLTDSAPPAVVRLPPLSAAEATALAHRLAELQGISSPDAQAVFSRTGGSPRLLHRLVYKSTEAQGGDEEALAQTLQALRPAARRLLVLARILAGKLPASEWLLAAGGLMAEQRELATLTHYHLVDPTRWTVPDPVWNTLLTLVGARELKSAHRLAAQLHLRRCAGAQVGSAAAAAALSAVQHQVAAGEPLAAWATFQLWAYTFCATGLGGSALALLPTLRAELPGQRLAIDLLAIRLLLSQGQLEPAQALLAESGSAAGPVEAVRWQLLAGQVAQRAGQLSRAGEHFRLAQAAAASPHERFLAAVHRAELAALRGSAAEAGSLLSAIPDDSRGPVELSPAEQLRLGCATARSLLLLGQPAAAVQAVAAVRRTDAQRPALPAPAPAPRPPDDPEVTLGVLATLAHSGCGDPVAARRALEQVRFFATATGAPAAHVIAYCSGVIQLTAGQLPAAQPPLQHAHGVFVAQLDFVPAAAAAIALGSCALAMGEFTSAARQLGGALRQLTRAGCAPLQRLASALRASAFLAAGQTEPALALCTAVLADAEAPPRARALARSVRWRAYALAGDAAGASHELATATAEVERTEQEFLRLSQALEHAEFAAAYGCPRAAIAHAEHAQQFFGERGMQHEVARAHLALALARASRREPADLALCQESLAVVGALAARYSYGPLLLGAALVEAALSHQRGDAPAARDQLEQALADNPTAAHGLAAQPLRAALSGPDENGCAGTTALLTRLGFPPSGELTGLPTAQLALRSPRGRRLLPRPATGAEHARFELTIDLERSELRVDATGRRVSGRPLMCSLLAHLAAAGPLGTDAERLFREVWRGTDYHPLRHRNTIHVALTRLRQLLRELLPKRELLETTATGWRLAPESSVCTLGAACR